jgi:hypothetical protein
MEVARVRECAGIAIKAAASRINVRRPFTFAATAGSEKMDWLRNSS